MINYHLRAIGTCKVAQGNASTLVLGSEPARYVYRVAPATGDVTVSVEVPAYPVVAMVFAAWVVDVEHHQVLLAVAVYVG
jgi:hypothetical protein